MSRLNELKEKYAVQQGFDSWKGLWFDTTNFKHANEKIDGLVKMYAEECCKASLEKAKNNYVKSFDKEKPITYRSGNWDGKNSDVVIAISKEGKYFFAYFNDGIMDGEKFECWYDENEYLIEAEITHWMEPDYFKESITNPENIVLL